MTTLQMYFCGLICHVGTRAEKDFAVVLPDPAHEHQFQLIHSPVARPVALADDVTFDLDVGPVQTTDAFDRFVPSLNRILHANLLSAVRTGTSKRVHYMAYPAGATLDVAKLYCCRAQHTGLGVPRRTDCVAMVTYLAADTTGREWVTIKSGTTQVQVPADSCVLFANHIPQYGEPLPCGDNEQHGHFRLYETLMLDPEFSDVRELREKCEETVAWPDGNCTWIRDYIRRLFTSIHVECGNSAYP